MLAGGEIPGGTDTLVHLEVKQHVPRPGPADRADFLRVNVDGTARWLEWCGRVGIRRVIYLSSIKAVRAAPEGPTLEAAEGPAGSPYGDSKWQAERLVREWVEADSSRAAVILRPAVIYGPGSTANIAAMMTALRRRRFFLVGTNDNRKSLASVDNVVAAIAFVGDRMILGKTDVFNVADTETITVRQLDGRLRRALGRSGNSPTLPLSVARLAAGAGEVFHRLAGRELPLNRSRLAALLETTWFPPDKLLATGFKPVRTLDEGLTELVLSAPVLSNKSRRSADHGVS